MPESPLRRFVLLYAAMYAAYGVASPFFPAFLHARGATPAELGLLLGAGTAVRLASAPLAGRLGDLWHALRAVLVACVALAALFTLAYLPARAFMALLAVALLQAAALAPMTVLADALTLGASKRHGFEYGWARGTGSAAFIAGTLASGQAVGAMGLDVIVGLQASLLALAALAALGIPTFDREPQERAAKRHMATLFRIREYRLLVLVAALVLGSHAMQDGFAVIRWREAGVGAATSSLLWSESVAAEVIVFFVVGPRLLRWLTPAGALALAALAGVARWTVMAQTADVAALAAVQPLHGLTFALLHLACMRLIAALVPPGLEGTAQAIYATLGVGGATAILTLASGALYGELGASGFWFMAALCAAALPLAWQLRRGTMPSHGPEAL